MIVRGWLVLRMIMLTLWALMLPGNLSAQPFIVDSLEADGTWCPMAHCNRNHTSFQAIPPLLAVGAIETVTHPAVSPSGFILPGCTTGGVMAVCAYDSPSHAAVVAYDYQDASVKWMSPLEDLPGENHRSPAGLLLAKIGVNGNPAQRYVFAANALEFVAYGVDGTRVWKRASRDISPMAPDGIGWPVSLSFSDAKELVTVTTKGWVVKLNPVDGSTIDAYKMETNVVVGGIIYAGTFTTTNSPIVIGNVLYVVVRFTAEASNPLPHFLLSPVHVVRIQLNQPGVPGMQTRIKPLTRPDNPGDPTPDRALIGVHRAGGSPPAWLGPDGKVFIFADADAFVDGELWPAVAAVVDDQGVLSRKWRSVINHTPGDDIVAAPALHASSRTLLVGTKNNLYVFRNVDTLAGAVPPPSPVPTADVLKCGTDGGVAGVTLGSRFGLTYNRGTNEIVAYTNVQVFLTEASPIVDYLGAFSVSAKGSVVGRPLWCHPLAVMEPATTAPRFGAAGQPALFRYASGSGNATGLIVSTQSTGTYIFRSSIDAPFDPSTLFDRISLTETAVSLIGQGFQLQAGSIFWSCVDDPTCIGNPITQYGYARLPTVSGARTSSFSLRGDDAFVVYGLTPGEITHFGLTPNQFSQFNPATRRYVVTRSSIGLGLNQLTINTLGGPYNALFAVIVSASHTVTRAVHDALREAGVAEGSISHLLIPERFANKGEPFPDVLEFLIRLSYRTSEERQQITDYVSQHPPNMRLLFFEGPGGPGNVLDSDLVRWEDTLRSDTSEVASGVDGDLEILADRISQKYQGEGYTLANAGVEELKHEDSQRDCRDVFRDCYRASPDGTYGELLCPAVGSQAAPSACTITLPSATDFVIVAGVDHHRYAGDTLATYFLHTSFTKDSGAVAAIVDLDIAGSATAYLEGEGIDPANLYAIKISRSCGGSPYCVEVPSGAGGIPLARPFVVTTRIFLDKVTGTGPNPANFVPGRLLRFVK